MPESFQQKYLRWLHSHTILCKHKTQMNYLLLLILMNTFYIFSLCYWSTWYVRSSNIHTKRCSYLLLLMLHFTRYCIRTEYWIIMLILVVFHEYWKKICILSSFQFDSFIKCVGYKRVLFCIHIEVNKSFWVRDNLLDVAWGEVNLNEFLK